VDREVIRDGCVGKIRAPQRLHFGVSQTGKSNIKGTLTFEVANPEIPKGERLEHVKDSISEFQIPGVGRAKSRDPSSKESQSCEKKNAEILK
jgi:hypothetical protein